MSSLFESLPREIRDEIYTYVFTSPTSYIVLHDRRDPNNLLLRTLGIPFSIIPYNPKTPTYPELKSERRPSVPYFHTNGPTPYSIPLQIQNLELEAPNPSAHFQDLSSSSATLSIPTLKLSLLYTSKKIHSETKDLLFQLNTLHLLHSLDISYIMIWPSLSFQLSSRLRSISMSLELFIFEKYINTERAFQTFIHWSRIGVLRKITLFLVKESTRKDGCIASFDELIMWRDKYHMQPFRRNHWPPVACCEKYLKLLRDVGTGKEGFPTNVVKEMRLYTGLLDLIPLDEDRTLPFLRSIDADGFARDLNEFGGELWMDEVLCYKDGVRIHDMFADPVKSVQEVDS